MKVLLSAFFIGCLFFLAHPSFGQSKLTDDLSLRLLIKMGHDIHDPGFKKKYGITPDSCKSLLSVFTSLPSDTARISTGKCAVFTIDTLTYYIDTSYFADDLAMFRTFPGDCGWIANLVLFNYMPGKEKAGEEFIRKRGYKTSIIDTSNHWFNGDSEATRKVTYCLHHGFFTYAPNAEYFVRGMYVGSMKEEQIIWEMLHSGLFLHASRDGIECGGFYTRSYVKRKYIFGSNTPAQGAGINFLRSFFENHIRDQSAVAVISTSDFTYDITLIGPSKYLSLKQDNLWERLSFKVFFQNGFDRSPDEMEMEIEYGDYAVAKGPEDKRPPLIRFDESASGGSNYSQYNAASYFIISLFNTMAVKCGGNFAERGAGFHKHISK
jgi:hypothetical protein